MRLDAWPRCHGPALTRREAASAAHAGPARRVDTTGRIRAPESSSGVHSIRRHDPRLTRANPRRRAQRARGNPRSGRRRAQRARRAERRGAASRPGAPQGARNERPKARTAGMARPRRARSATRAEPAKKKSAGVLAPACEHPSAYLGRSGPPTDRPGGRPSWRLDDRWRASPRCPSATCAPASAMGGRNSLRRGSSVVNCRLEVPWQQPSADVNERAHRRSRGSYGLCAGKSARIPGRGARSSGLTENAGFAPCTECGTA